MSKRKATEYTEDPRNSNAVNNSKRVHIDPQWLDGRDDGATHRHWFVTMFHYEREEVLRYLKNEKGLDHYSIGFEVCPETKQAHCHIAMRYKNAVRFSKLKQFCPSGKGKINWVRPAVYGSKAEYTQKDGDYVEEGEAPTRGESGSANIVARNKSLETYRDAAKAGELHLIPESEYRRYHRYYNALRDDARNEGGRNERKEWAVSMWKDRELRPWQKKIMDIIEAPPHDRQIYWVYDPDGGAGKTQFCDYVECVVEKKCQVLQPMKGSDLAHLVIPSKEVYFFDIPRVAGEYVPWSFIENLKNGRVISGKYEGALKFFRPPHVIVLSNDLPPETSAHSGFSADRIMIINV